MSSDVQLEFSGGRGALIRQALAFAGVGTDPPTAAAGTDRAAGCVPDFARAPL